MEAVGDEAVPANRHRRLVALLRGGQAHDPGGVVVDATAGENAERLAVDEQSPQRQVAHVGVEEPLGLRGLDITAGGGEEVGAAVEDGELGRHRVRCYSGRARP